MILWHAGNKRESGVDHFALVLDPNMFLPVEDDGSSKLLLVQRQCRLGSLAREEYTGIENHLAVTVAKQQIQGEQGIGAAADR
jgi:hypothetical protein